MDFFKRLFRKDESLIPIPRQKIPGIEPIVVQAVENLFPDVNAQKTAFKYILEVTTQRKSVADPQTLLALLRYSNGDVESFHKAAWQSHPHFWMDEIGHIFRTMEDTEEWVKSLAKS